MPYLDPPPFPAPVEVMKDVGGYVTDYRAQTERYRQEDREVRLHECRSACTLALSLPGVCVYPTSILKFHKAYDANTKVPDEAVSDEMFKSYPTAVQARLGELTRNYKVLTGAELIALGVRNCNDGRTMVARARPPAPATTLASAAPAGGTTPGLGGVLQSVLSAVPRPFEAAGPDSAAAAPTPVGPASIPKEQRLDAPVPPRRPSDLGTVEVAAYAPKDTWPEPQETRLPPPGLPEIIPGSPLILPSGSFAFGPWTGR